METTSIEEKVGFFPFRVWDGWKSWPSQQKEEKFKKSGKGHVSSLFHERVRNEKILEFMAKRKEDVQSPDFADGHSAAVSEKGERREEDRTIVSGIKKVLHRARKSRNFPSGYPPDEFCFWHVKISHRILQSKQ
jgi:hypothetical protein